MIDTQTPTISLQLFGGILVSDGAGYYPGLELMNYVYGCEEEILPDITDPTFVRRGQNFARRLVWDRENLLCEEEKSALEKGDTLDPSYAEGAAVLAHLLKCLEVEVPDRPDKGWWAAHFFPYTQSLVHWDARIREMRNGESEVRVERRYLRGGGALAHKVLRSDPNELRKEEVRSGLRELMPTDGSTPLESLAAVLAAKGKKNKAVTCDIEKAARPANDSLDEHYRAGTKSILSHRGLSSTSRIRALIIWTGFWLAVCQRDRSAARKKVARTPIIIDCGNSAGQLRRESVRALREITTRIAEAAADCLPKADDLKKKTRQDLIGFFTRSCAWIGMLNAFRGRRFFVMKLDLLESLVLAHVNGGEEISFEEFMAVLYEKYALVLGRDAAAKAGFLDRLDGSIFEDNEDRFASQLITAGLMQAYSDSTRMVGMGAI